MAPRILVYSATAGFRHDSIPASIEALKAKAASIEVIFDFTEDKDQFNDANLSKYDAILFLNNSGIVLDDAGKAALQKYLNLGGNFIGVHCASDAMRDTPFFLKQIGAYFDYHPDIQESVVDVQDRTHPSTIMLPERWRLLDEMYNFQSDPRVFGVKLLLTADESTYEDPGVRKFDHGTPHPIAWYQERGAGVESGGIAGRSWYTGLGHCIEIWSDELFLGHVLGGITWTLQSKTTLAFNASGKVGNPS
ncbi:class I glutamine amidotransferase-like protein [Leucogyrophana mollusca]|uniref:Class I glutamine amidotransferase-like protein n=1 Tax=Leucogyrophana mollusca TaxID=85980 RepID=A0ACB8BIT4_9AGAM|nr:class I glutamine amidotransferase-like protein [Leucogyrophana mollusca]